MLHWKLHYRLVPGDYSTPQSGMPSSLLPLLVSQERDDILSSLQRRSRMVHNALNKMEGVTCNRADGALYAFPRIRLSKKAQEAADKAGVPADEFYCLKVGHHSVRNVSHSVYIGHNQAQPAHQNGWSCTLG